MLPPFPFAAAAAPEEEGGGGPEGGGGGATCAATGLEPHAPMYCLCVYVYSYVAVCVWSDAMHTYVLYVANSSS